MKWIFPSNNGGEVDGFKFTEDVVDKKTMFADETNVAIVSFANDTEINIDDL